MLKADYAWDFYLVLCIYIYKILLNSANRDIL